MCSLRLSKSIFPFAVTFFIGMLVVGTFSYFNSPVKVKSVQANEVKVYKSTSKKSSCKTKTRAYKNNAYRSRSTRVVRPTLQETIIINEEVKKSK